MCTTGWSLIRKSANLTGHDGKRSTEGRLSSHRGNSGEKPEHVPRWEMKYSLRTASSPLEEELQRDLDRHLLPFK